MEIKPDRKRRVAGLVAVIGIGLIVVAFSAGCGGYVAETSVGIEEGYGNSNWAVLDQYGEWAVVRPFGEVWRPYVADTWRPFYYGDWIWTQDGWAWSSYEPYGWVVYHYGDWDYEPDIGWFWIPGDRWSPARVRWFRHGDYIGWAPIPPRGVTWPEPWEAREFHPWNIVPARDFTRDNVGNYRVKEYRPEGEGGRGKVRVEHKAPDRNFIQQLTNSAVERHKIQREKVKVGKHELQRMQMPDHERQRAEQHRPEVEKQTHREHQLKPVPHQEGRGREKGKGHEGKGNDHGRDGRGRN